MTGEKRSPGHISWVSKTFHRFSFLFPCSPLSNGEWTSAIHISFLEVLRLLRCFLIWNPCQSGLQHRAVRWSCGLPLLLQFPAKSCSSCIYWIYWDIFLTLIFLKHHHCYSSRRVWYVHSSGSSHYLRQGSFWAYPKQLEHKDLWELSWFVVRLLSIAG